MVFGETQLGFPLEFSKIKRAHVAGELLLCALPTADIKEQPVDFLFRNFLDVNASF